MFRFIRCFISESTRSDYYNLLLSLFWLFSVNAVIHIRESKIIIENSIQKKFMKKIVKSKITFCTEHILIMYSVKAFFKTYRSKKEKDNNSDNSFENESFENDFFDVDDKIHRKNFWLILNMTLNCLNQITKKSSNSF